MGFPTCEICDVGLSFFADNIHICDKEDIKKYTQRIKDNFWKAQNELDYIRNGVFLILRELPSLEEEKVSISTELLKNLWRAAGCCFFDIENPEDFTQDWMINQNILCEAFDVFRSEKYGHPQTLLEKLKMLKEVCDVAVKIRYPDSHLNMSPEDLIKEVKNEVSDRIM